MLGRTLRTKNNILGKPFHRRGIVPDGILKLKYELWDNLAQQAKRCDYSLYNNKHENFIKDDNFIDNVVNSLTERF